jgi:hypothetical protein
MYDEYVDRNTASLFGDSTTRYPVDLDRLSYLGSDDAADNWKTKVLIYLHMRRSWWVQLGVGCHWTLTQSDSFSTALQSGATALVAVLKMTKNEKHLLSA